MVGVAGAVTDGCVQEASADLVPPGCQAAWASVLGARALLFYRLDEQEHQRRRGRAAARLDDWGALETLMGLPLSEPVPLSLFSDRERRRLRMLPEGAADRDRRTVVRHAVRPLSLDLAVVAADSWRRGLELAGRFAPYCRRAILLERVPARSEEMLMEASFYGIGVLIGQRGQVEMLLEPRPHRPERHTAAAWRFIEQLYSDLV